MGPRWTAAGVPTANGLLTVACQPIPDRSRDDRATVASEPSGDSPEKATPPVAFLLRLHRGQYLLGDVEVGIYGLYVVVLL